MKKSGYLWVLAFTICIIEGCENNKRPDKSGPLQATNVHADTALSSNSTIRFYSIGTKNFIHYGRIGIQIPGDVHDSSTKIFDGIYELRSDSLIRHKALVVGKYLFVTTFADLGRGYQVYLHAIDTARRRSIIDPNFNRNFLYSSASFFLIHKDLIFVIDKSFESTSKKKEVTIGSLYKIEGGYFSDLKDVYRDGEQIPGDTSKLVWFFRSALLPKSENVCVLPKNWWKRKNSYF